MNLQNKVALITGAGQGLGEQIAGVLAATGIIVILLDMKEETVKTVEKDIKEKGGRAASYVVNVTHVDEAKKIISQVKNDYGEIDILVNNAGVDVTKSFQEMSFDEFEKVLDINLLGPFIMSKIVWEYMITQKKGHIVNITSTAAKRGWPNATAYHASKWGLLGFSEALYTEGRQHGIKVTAVVAGGMRTPFILERFPDTPLDVLQDPKNVAETILFVLQQPDETIIPEILVLPMKETSWP